MFHVIVLGIMLGILFEINYVEYTLHVGLFNYMGTFSQFMLDSFYEILSTINFVTFILVILIIIMVGCVIHYYGNNEIKSRKS